MAVPRVNRQVRKGDLVVTAVARHYVVGRVITDYHTQQFLRWHPTRAEAVADAFAHVAAPHRVFIYENAGNSGCRALRDPHTRVRLSQSMPWVPNDDVPSDLGDVSGLSANERDPNCQSIPTPDL
jgi:hypothetical protein